MANHKIGIIVGSLREGSINRKIARSMCAIRDDDLSCSMIEIGDLPLFNQDLEKTPPDAMGPVQGAGRGVGRHPVLHARI